MICPRIQAAASPATPRHAAATGVRPFHFSPADSIRNYSLTPYLRYTPQVFDPWHIQNQHFLGAYFQR
ncbi:MAG: hypothetical protein ACRER5_05410, partial [Pseudomonas sp.]